MFRFIKVFVFTLIVCAMGYSYVGADVVIDVSASRVCNLFYGFPEGIEGSGIKVILRDLEGNIIDTIYVDSGGDIFFEGIEFGKYYIEIEGYGFFPVSVGSDYLMNAHVRKVLDFGRDLYGEEESRIFSYLGYSGGSVPASVLAEVRDYLYGVSASVRYSVFGGGAGSLLFLIFRGIFLVLFFLFLVFAFICFVALLYRAYRLRCASFREVSRGEG